MTDSTTGRWLRAINPLNIPRGMAEAQRSARGLAIGIGLSWLANVPVMIWTMQSPAFMQQVEQQYGTMGLSPSEVAMQQAMMPTIMPIAMGLALLFSAAIYGGVAYVQWRWKTRTIPMVLLSFFVFGAIATLGLTLFGNLPAPEQPVWAEVLGWGVGLVAAVIYVAALQGAIMLHSLKGRR